MTPRRSPLLIRFFAGAMARALRRGFHAVRLARPGWPELPPDRPVIVYLNHPSWWDPALAILFASTRFAERPGFGPIDAAMLKRYPFLGRIGLFGIEPDTRRGAAEFLRVSHAVLRDGRAMLWITAEGRFTDPRARPVRLRPGLAHLARHAPEAMIVPLAVEYPFWDERTPEALARFGEPFAAARMTPLPTAEISEVLAARLQAAMDDLAEDAVSRDPARFLTVMGGTVGVGGVYDAWRRGRAWLSGRGFHAGHGAPEP